MFSSTTHVALITDIPPDAAVGTNWHVCPSTSLYRVMGAGVGPKPWLLLTSGAAKCDRSWTADVPVSASEPDNVLVDFHHYMADKVAPPGDPVAPEVVFGDTGSSGLAAARVAARDAARAKIAKSSMIVRFKKPETRDLVKQAANNADMPAAEWLREAVREKLARDTAVPIRIEGATRRELVVSFDHEDYDRVSEITAQIPRLVQALGGRDPVVNERTVLPEGGHAITYTGSGTWTWTEHGTMDSFKVDHNTNPSHIYLKAGKIDSWPEAPEAAADTGSSGLAALKSYDLRWDDTKREWVRSWKIPSSSSAADADDINVPAPRFMDFPRPKPFCHDGKGTPSLVLTRATQYRCFPDTDSALEDGRPGNWCDTLDPVARYVICKDPTRHMTGTYIWPKNVQAADVRDFDLLDRNLPWLCLNDGFTYSWDEKFLGWVTGDRPSKYRAIYKSRSAADRIIHLAGMGLGIRGTRTLVDENGNLV